MTLTDQEVEEGLKALNKSFRNTIHFCDSITRVHIENNAGRSWSTDRQLNQVLSEMGEFWNADRDNMRYKPGHHDYVPLPKVEEELFDIYYSALTLIRIFYMNRGYSDDYALTKMEEVNSRVFHKLMKRVGLAKDPTRPEAY